MQVSLGVNQCILGRPANEPAQIAKVLPMKALVLYQRDDCALCDEALIVLMQAGCSEPESQFIDDDPALEARYGQRVPVLAQRGRETELDWPFDAAAVKRFACG